MVRIRPILALSAGLALLGGPVLAAAGDPADVPAAGAATSTLTLIDLALGAKKLSVLELALRSDTVSGDPTTSFVVTPLAVDGTAYGRQSLSSRSAVLPAVDSASLAPPELSAVATARSPQIDVRSEGGTSSATAGSLGGLSVLGLPLQVEGATSISAGVDGSGAAGSKTLTVTRLALPSLADLLAALGLDLRALPTDALTDLLDGLDLGTTLTDEARAALEQAVADVQAELAAAEAAVAAADADVRWATEQLAAEQDELAAATTTLNDATVALTGVTAGLRVGSLIGIDPVVEIIDDGVQVVEETVDPVLTPITDTVTEPVVEAVEPVLVEAPDLTGVPDPLDPLVQTYNEAKAAYDAAVADVAEAQALLDTATTLLADAQAALAGLLAPISAQVDAVVDAVMGVLDATPLVSLDRLEVTTRSAVTSAEPDGQSAEVVGGEIEGLRILGTDVLATTLGSSSVEVLDLTAPVQTQLDSVITGLTGTLSEVLSQVPGLPGLNVPAPTVSLLTRATSTGVVDGFGTAGSALRALTVSWPGITVPAAAALPGATTLPAVTGLSAASTLGASAVGDVLSQPLTLGIATLEDRARFRAGQQSVQPGDGTTEPGTEAPGTQTPDAGTPGSQTPDAGTPGTQPPASPGTATPGTATPGTPTDGSAQPPTTTANPRTTPVGLTQLPRTGADSGPATLALLLVAAGLGMHRRLRTA